MRLRHFISSEQMSRAELEALFLRIDGINRQIRTGGLAARRELREKLHLRHYGSLFFEPSTRTRFSFEQAALMQGMLGPTTENASEFSSTKKGETLEDTIRVMGGYCLDVLFVRHRDTGASIRSAQICDQHGLPMSIVNAGDGVGEHPTQSALDLYTIWKEKSHRGIDGLTVVVGGDIKHGRTIRSLVLLLSLFRVKIIFVAPEGFEAQDGVKAVLKERGIEFREERDLAAAFPEADVIYWTRVQRERIEDRELLAALDLAKYTIDLKALSLVKPDVTIMHPLPRVGEISPEVDIHPGAAYFRQAANGLPVRMALLQMICGAP